MDIPANRNLRMPAEWEPHAATWLSWPHNPATWPRFLAAAEAAMVDIAAALAPHEHVHINVLSTGHRDHVNSLLRSRVPPDAVSTHIVPTNDAWIRDHGSIFVNDLDTDGRVALDFRYNAWGNKYPPYDEDQRVATAMANLTESERIGCKMVLEGGSIDVNGVGALLTTTQCLLNPNRNPGMSRSDIEQYLGQAFGVDTIIWLGEGIEGDDTDGHVDDITRFVAPAHIVSVSEPDPHDPNHLPLQRNIEMLEQLRLGNRAVELTILPMPDALFSGPQRLPASYGNFYIANNVVLMPVFACERDAEAQAILQGCFPDREVIPIDSRALVHGLGAIHCLTQQLPALR